MSKKATIIAVVNQKGGTGKTTTTENLGVGLALEGKKVLLVDTDPQASLTVSLGNPCPDDLSPTLSDLMGTLDGRALAVMAFVRSPMTKAESNRNHCQKWSKAVWRQTVLPIGRGSIRYLWLECSLWRAD